MQFSQIGESFVFVVIDNHVTGVNLMTVRPRYREGASCSLSLRCEHTLDQRVQWHHLYLPTGTHQLSNLMSSSALLAFRCSALSSRAFGYSFMICSKCVQVPWRKNVAVSLAEAIAGYWRRALLRWRAVVECGGSPAGAALVVRGRPLTVASMLRCFP